MEASSKAEPEVIDEVSPEETVEEELDLDVNFNDDFKLKYNSEIDIHESPKDNVVGSDTNGRLQDKDLNDGIAYSETANLHENV